MTTRTRQLTRELASERVMVSLQKKKNTFIKKLFTVFVLPAFIIGGAFYIFDERASSVWLFGQQAVVETFSSEERWRAELDRLQVKYQVELAAREALEQQILTLDAQIKEMQTELDFFRSNNGQTRAAKPAANGRQ